ncbi:LytR/AlgR family response regulator transcription factor [Flagellimonas sp. 2504JD1-5]
MNRKHNKLSERKEKYLLGVILIFIFNTLNYHLAYDVEWFSPFFFKTFINDLLMGLTAWTFAFFLINKLNKFINSKKQYVIRYLIMYALVSIPAILILIIWTTLTSTGVNEQNVELGFYTHTLLIIALEAAFINHIYLNYKTMILNSLFSNPPFLDKIEMISNRSTYYVDGGQIPCFFSEFNVTRAFDAEGKKYSLDKNLKELETTLDPTLFFRANRQFIVNRNAIVSVTKTANKKLLIQIDQGNDVIDISISRTKSPSFKKWLNGKVQFNIKSDTLH